MHPRLLTKRGASCSPGLGAQASVGAPAPGWGGIGVKKEPFNWIKKELFFYIKKEPFFRSKKNLFLSFGLGRRPPRPPRRSVGRSVGSPVGRPVGRSAPRGIKKEPFFRSKKNLFFQIKTEPVPFLRPGAPPPAAPPRINAPPGPENVVGVTRIPPPRARKRCRGRKNAPPGPEHVVGVAFWAPGGGTRSRGAISSDRKKQQHWKLTRIQGPHSCGADKPKPTGPRSSGAAQLRGHANPK